MKPPHYLKIFGLFIILLLTSCGTYYHFPTKQNVLDFKQKGDVNASAGIGLWSRNVSAGYAISDHIAVVSDFNTFNHSNDFGIGDGHDDKRFGSFLWDHELILYKKTKNDFYPAVNIGYGFGALGRNNEYYDLSLERFTFQPSIGYNSGILDVAFSTRFSRVTYDLTQLKEFNDDDPRGRTFDEVFDLRDVGDKPFYFYEPALTLGLVIKKIKLRYQYSKSIQINDADIKFHEGMSFLSISLNFNLNDIKSK